MFFEMMGMVVNTGLGADSGESCCHPQSLTGTGSTALINMFPHTCPLWYATLKRCWFRASLPGGMRIKSFPFWRKDNVLQHQHLRSQFHSRHRASRQTVEAQLSVPVKSLGSDLDWQVAEEEQLVPVVIATLPKKSFFPFQRMPKLYRTLLAHERQVTPRPWRDQDE